MKEVYLFGSHAHSTPDDESDVDLCIVSDLKGQRRIDVMIRARKALGTVTTEPIDIIVYEESPNSVVTALCSTIFESFLNSVMNIRLTRFPEYRLDLCC